MCEATTDDAYFCLSNEWGTDEPSRSIIINDVVFAVRQNLWNFLNEARHPQSRYCYVWPWIYAI